MTLSIPSDIWKPEFQAIIIEPHQNVLFSTVECTVFTEKQNAL